MIDKIDRPEATPHYQITRAKDAKEDQHHQHNPREEQEKRYREELEGKAWSKFDRRTTIIKPLRVERSSILRCLFRTVNLHSGIGTLQVDVAWKDGKTTHGALVLLRNLEDFIKLKKLAPGQEVPEEFWTRGDKVELGIIQQIASATAGMMSQKKKTEAQSLPARAGKSLLTAVGIVDEQKKINWGIVALYSFLVIIITLVVALQIGK